MVYRAILVGGAILARKSKDLESGAQILIR
jgi:hypothetical protein